MSQDGSFSNPDSLHNVENAEISAIWIKKSEKEVEDKKKQAVASLSKQLQRSEEEIARLLVIDEKVLQIEGKNFAKRTTAIGAILTMCMDAEKRTRNEPYFSSTIASYEKGKGAKPVGEIYTYRFHSDGISESTHSDIVGSAVSIASQISRDMGSVEIPNYNF